MHALTLIHKDVQSPTTEKADSDTGEFCLVKADSDTAEFCLVKADSGTGEFFLCRTLPQEVCHF